MFPAAKIYLVGGIVRDTLIGEHVKSKDYDFIICGVPHQELEAAMTKLGQWTFAGKNFGVYKFRPYNFTLKHEFDIALPRTEKARGTGRRADVDVQSDHTMKVEDDLGRRDLTINAMAWDLRNHTLIDPFHGRQDLRDRKIRSVGNPFDRFTEDRSRMLRAIRFACKFNFALDPLTYDAIESFMPRINDAELNPETNKVEKITPMETVKTEIFKTLAADPSKAFRLLEKTGAWRAILPELDILRNNPEIWKQLKTSLEILSKENLEAELAEEYTLDVSTFHKSGDFVFAVILYYLKLALPPQVEANTKKATRRDNPINQIYHRFVLTNPEKNKASWLIDNIDVFTTGLPTNWADQEKLLAHQHTADALALALIIHQTDDQLDDHLRYENQKDAINAFGQLFAATGELPPPLLNGRDILQELNMDKGGPIVAEIQKKLRHLQLSGRIKDKKTAIEWLKTHSL